METTSTVLRRLDAFCARLNGGLMVLAAALALIILVVACEQRMPEIASLFRPIDPETGISMLSY